MILLLLMTMVVQQGGTVTGVLKDATGKPAVGVRVAAVIQSDPTAKSAGPEAMARIVETDAEGRYLLDDVPQGRYFISAGRVDQPTYYTGAKEMARATVVSVMPGSAVSGIDFTLDQASAGLAIGMGTTFNSIVAISSSTPALNLPLELRVEDGGKIPISSGGTALGLVLRGSPDRFEAA
jgi:hypothetical protein